MTAKTVFPFTIFVLVLASPRATLAQSEPGVVSGIVRDSSGAAIPSAIVRVTHESTGGGVELISNDRGSYRTAGLAPGLYRVEATLDGFEAPARRVVLETGQTLAIDITLSPSRVTEAVIVTARRVEEVAQEVPIPISVVGSAQVGDTGAFNVNRLKEQIPTVQFYSTNPRNSSVQIRGLGAPFGLTNDGIEPGAGRMALCGSRT